MRIGKGNRSTRRKRAPMPLYPPQIPHDVTWARTRAAAVGSRRITAWAMARSSPQINLLLHFTHFFFFAEESGSLKKDSNQHFINCVRYCDRWTGTDSAEVVLALSRYCVRVYLQRLGKACNTRVRALPSERSLIIYCWANLIGDNINGRLSVGDCFWNVAFVSPYPALFLVFMYRF
jgi:hypothetical protein